MKKKLVSLFIVLIIAAMIFAGCASTASNAPAESYAAASSSAPPAMDEGFADVNGEMPQEAAAPGDVPKASTQTSSEGGSGNAIVVPDTTRKIILTQYIETNTKNFDADMEKLNAALKVADRKSVV